jgi:hypothetical protein
LSWDRRHKAPFPLFEFWQLGALGDDLPELVGLWHSTILTVALSVESHTVECKVMNYKLFDKRKILPKAPLLFANYLPIPLHFASNWLNLLPSRYYAKC